MEKVFLKMHLTRWGLFLLLGLNCSPVLRAQSTYLFFQDSPGSVYYEYSWMDVSGASELERKSSDNRKFPVETGVPAQQGENCLRLKWRSMEGGNWLAIAAGNNWDAKDISQADTLVFWMQSPGGISQYHLPHVFMEDVSNAKSSFIDLSEHGLDLPAGQWIRTAIPMEVFFNSGGGVDYTTIKTIGFSQSIADGEEHLLLIDNMRVNVGDGGNQEVAAPETLKARAFERHVELTWEPSTDPVTGYQVERSADGGETFSLAGSTTGDTVYIDWTGDPGQGMDFAYRVRALNGAGEPWGYSPEAAASTGLMSDEELLDMVQEYTFRYFWDHAHPASGAARERKSSGNTVTSGGTGFGLMAIPVGIERGFISREDGVARITKLLDFLEGADRFHGAWSHWINGNTGKAIPFSQKDNGGDIVETAFLAQGLLTIRQYFSEDDPLEKAIAEKATALWEGIEWDWYRQEGSSVITWHWSPDYQWEMNMAVRGWNEAAIVYLCAIASPTHGVDARLWKEGWAGRPDYVNGNDYFGIPLYLGSKQSLAGPLFFAHYSFLGFDPRGIRDDYADYFDQNRNHSLIQQAYCQSNPRGHSGYSQHCWGLTASDDPDGYLAHEPNTDRDNGTITPTAALSSFPYTPEESMLALKHFYRELGEKTWGWMGFYDAFNEGRDWWANSYLAIDQGPILLMMENYRSQLLWKHFMSNPEIEPMLNAIGFRPVGVQGHESHGEGSGLSLFPNPAGDELRVAFNLESSANVAFALYNASGTRLGILQESKLEAGKQNLTLDVSRLQPGLYYLQSLINGRAGSSSKAIIL